MAKKTENPAHRTAKKNPHRELPKMKLAELNEDIRCAEAELAAWKLKGDEQRTQAAIAERAAGIAKLQAEVAVLEDEYLRAGDEIKRCEAKVAKLRKERTGEILKPAAEKLVNTVAQVAELLEKCKQDPSYAEDPQVKRLIEYLTTGK
jgi:predicted  nucleic acid-binding Zn-ribbon protein